MTPWVWIVSSGIVSVIAIVGNATVIYIIVTRKTLRTTANVFISSLAASDLGVGFTSFVFGAYLARHYLSSEGALQEAFDFLSSIFYGASVLNLCMMVLDRYIAIAIPYKYLTIITRGRVILLVLLCWFAPVITSLIPVLWFSSDKEHEQANTIFYQAVSIFFVVTSYLILIPITLHVYLITRRHLRSINVVHLQLQFNHGRRSSFRGTDMSSSKVLLIAAVVFTLCYSVHLSQDICDLCSCDCSLNSDLTTFLLLLNSAINPFVYSLHKRDIRRELKNLVTKPRCS